MSEIPLWLKELEVPQTLDAPLLKKQVLSVTSEVKKLLRNREYSKVDNILVYAQESSTLPDIFRSTILRITFVSRKKLTKWYM